MAHFLNRNLFKGSTGTGTFNVGAAVAGFRTPAQAGAVNGRVYSYWAESPDGSQWELGNGVYSSSGPTLTRGVIESSNSNALVNFSVQPNVSLSPLADDIAIPPGARMGYFGTVAPPGWLLCDGAPVSRTTFKALFDAIGTVAGVGNGSTTFNVPDFRGRAGFGKDDMGGSAANRLTNQDDGIAGSTLAAVGGGQTQVLVTGNLPPYTPSGSITNGNITLNSATAVMRLTGSGGSVAGGTFNFSTANLSASQAASSFTGTAQGGTSTAFGIIPPGIVENVIIKT